MLDPDKRAGALSSIVEAQFSKTIGFTKLRGNYLLIYAWTQETGDFCPKDRSPSVKSRLAWNAILFDENPEASPRPSTKEVTGILTLDEGDS
ncbi:hypothetical protein Q3G72_006967 [Acer saccharum]|nr:hypothetical protein Q3G72_006967 [Acer saccharum]